MTKHINNKNGNGIYNRSAWLRESERLYKSALILRAEGISKKDILKESDSFGENGVELIYIIESTNKSSRLLLGYAFEMLLKSGVLVLNYGAQPKTLQNIFKRDCGHNLRKMCASLSIDLTTDESNLLDLAEKDIVSQARYPITPISDNDYIEDLNVMSKNMGNEEVFNKLKILYQKLKSIITSLDKSDGNFAFLNSIVFDNDGVVFSRAGGKLPPRVIIKFSTKQKKSGVKTKDTLKYMLEVMQQSNKAFSPTVLVYWDKSEFFEDTGNKLVPIT